MTKTYSKESKIITRKYLVSFVKYNGVESWNKYPNSTMMYKAGSSKHFDGRGTLWLIKKTAPILISTAGISEK